MKTDAEYWAQIIAKARGISTAEAAQVMAREGFPGVHEWKPSEHKRNPQLEKRDAIFAVLARLFPQLDMGSRARLAEFGSGIAHDRYEEFRQRTPNLLLAPPSLNTSDQGRLAAALRNLGPDNVDKYVDVGPLD